MSHKPTIHVLGLAVTISFAVFGSAAQGDIIKRSGPGSAQEAASVPGSKLAPKSPMKIECWQAGKRIISEDGFSGFTVDSLREGKSISLRRAPRGNVDVVVVSTKYTTCLIRHSARAKSKSQDSRIQSDFEG